MEHISKSIFITGRAGTGKSTLLSYFCHTTKKKVVVLAPTGVAALNVKGQTIHSFFRFKPAITLDLVRRVRSGDDKRNIYKKLDAIVIDEIRNNSITERLLHLFDDNQQARRRH